MTVSPLVLFPVQFLLAYNNLSRPAVTFTFRFSSATMIFVKPSLSSGPQVSAKPVVTSAVYIDAVTQSA